MATRVYPRIDTPVNPYQTNVQGKANEPICVAGLLDHARRLVGYEGRPDWTLEEIYDRLEANAPRVAIIGGSSDHPAHIVDPFTVAHAALRIWENGGVPFGFSIPVMCDGTAQSTMGMSYSLQSRNAVAMAVVNQMESHGYHAAFVIQGCDKTPTGILSGLAHLDLVRRRRGEAPVWASFAPAHVLRGGSIPEKLRAELEQLARRAEAEGYTDLAEDVRDTAAYILQCSSNTAWQGVLERAVQVGLLTRERHKAIERELAVNTCHHLGGVCAFNGTGNSSRHVVAGLGMAHPRLELLTDPPDAATVAAAVDDLFRLFNRPEYSVREIVGRNIANAIRIHSASGGSTNLMMHLVAVMLYAGYRFTLWDLDRIRRSYPVPDLFDYSLTQGRDIFALAQHTCAGHIRGMETLFHELLENGVPMDLDAPTVTGTTWRERLAVREGLSALGVRENPIILHTPRRPFSGIEVLTGNWFESAVVKVSGMTTAQLDEFDGRPAFVLYYENEDEANRSLLDVGLLAGLRAARAFPRPEMEAMYRLTGGDGDASEWPYDELWDRMVAGGHLRIAIVIAGQGPEAFGMPEMFTPMQHINANRQLRRLTCLLSDGRYSGVTYGAAIGHVTPEAARGGGILYLRTGDVLLLGLRRRRIDLLDAAAFREGRLEPYAGNLAAERAGLGQERLARIRDRRRQVAAVNRMVGFTDASAGVVPPQVFEEADEPLPALAGVSPA
ncbi:dihydroxy-acid dehydratase domain-containing protein [Caldinitratiruptor microaerophilus]|uniref:Dihydroxy-acid dehydratase n=1 Tax=Caldinitratiruptor microaerophilus TaxID=671077 RepID=A0AA35CKP2_9FIRM|nr:dihydroxy-acid dehydratase [Caldinitratiruptor microaerophilus]BDG60188.1 hypothetical protein caldi_12780 [Caldinitratiruptor microaerophilus]